jgi:glutamate carboxypeptidase
MENDIRWLDLQFENMCQLLELWVSINSYSFNEEGLTRFSTILLKEFALLMADTVEIMPYHILRLKKRATAPIQVLLGGHMDTVFAKEEGFLTPKRLNSGMMQGPGVTDMKGGLVVLLNALKCFEQSEYAKNIGWEIFINSDEEIGSIHSTPFLQKFAKKKDIGLLFEPCLPDGSLVSSRKASAYYEIYSKGVKAHVGRDFEKGKNAFYPLARWIVQAEKFMKEHPSIIINIGSITGGTIPNIVPDLATCHVNVRTDNESQMNHLENEIHNWADQNGLFVKKTIRRPAKQLNPETEFLLHEFKRCSDELGIPLKWRGTGGVCDGNILSASGLPTIDSLGVRGDYIHTHNEIIYLDSLVERSKLTALFLLKLGAGIFKMPRKTES